MLEHGGAIGAAAARYGIAVEDWLDLSTGINSQGWPVPTVPADIWRRLPETNDGLHRVAADYYGSDQLLSVAGSQAVIQALPALRPPCRVGVLNPSYAEHAHAWRRWGHQVEVLPSEAIPETVNRLDVLVVINPNNPTGMRFDPDILLDWHKHLAERGGWLVVDEAFMDATPQASIVAYAGLPGLVILRSLGKFFGLAGARIGFAFAEAEWRARLQEYLGPWTVNGPGRWVAAQALADFAWQEGARARLRRDSDRLTALLGRQGLTVAGGTALFQWSTQPDAEFFQDALARRGILVRRFNDPPSLRLGLPSREADWRRLELAMAGVRAERLTLVGPDRGGPGNTRLGAGSPDN